jgi:hypothetical protein
MDRTQIERIRTEAHRRLGAQGRPDTSDLSVRLEGDTVVLEGSVDDAYAKSLVESVAREVAGAAVRSKLTVRDDIGAEAAAKDTEFGTEAAAHRSTSTIPRPE